MPAVDAQKVAYAAILKTLAGAARDADEKSEPQQLLSKVEAGRLDPPAYAPSHQ